MCLSKVDAKGPFCDKYTKNQKPDRGLKSSFGWKWRRSQQDLNKWEKSGYRKSMGDGPANAGWHVFEKKSQALKSSYRGDHPYLYKVEIRGLVAKGEGDGRNSSTALVNTWRWMRYVQLEKVSSK